MWHKGTWFSDRTQQIQLMVGQSLKVFFNLHDSMNFSYATLAKSLPEETKNIKFPV